MRQVEIGSITTDWYKPWQKEERLSRSAISRLRVLAGFCGRDTLGLCRKLMTGEALSREVAEVLNINFFESSKKIYKLPKKTDSQGFYLQQNKGAVAAVGHFGRLVPELASKWEMKDEIADLAERPSDLLRLLTSPSQKIDSVLAYEAQRHATLIYQIGMINARTLNGRLRTVLSDVNRLLNQKLFKGPEGHGDTTTVKSYHDDETNEVVGFQDRGDRIPLTAHVKHIEWTVRKTGEFGLVRTSSRKKDDSDAIAKSWAKARNNGGIIHINDAVQDSIGREYALLDDSIPPEQFADLVVSIIQAAAGEESDLWEIPKISKVETDNQVDASRGQAVRPSFNARRKIWFENIPTPIELKVSNRETFLNAELEVGTRDPETGLYNGIAHDLYRLRRDRPIVDVPFPQVVYPVDEYKINTAFVNRSKQESFRLRNMYKAA